MINCVIIDDEPLALDLLESFVAKTPSLNLIARCENALEALEIINREPVDLVFLDIEMPDITGIQLVKSLDKKPLIIFTTAYDKYAVEGFELDVVDYLLKPIPFERFVKAVNKASTLHLAKNPQAKPDETPDHIYVKADYQMVKVTIKDILYIEGLKDYIKIYLPQKTILTLLTLKGVEQMLPSKEFSRIHRSYIVPLKKIDAIRKNSLRIGEQEIPIGEKYKEEFMERLNL